MTQEEGKQLKEFEEAVKAVRDYSENQFDKLTISISSGAIGLAFAFFDNWKDVEGVSRNLIVFSLCLFASCILFSFCSHFLAIKSSDYLYSRPKLSDQLNNLVEVFNWGAFGSVVFGVILFVAFMIKIVI